MSGLTLSQRLAGIYTLPVSGFGEIPGSHYSISSDVDLHKYFYFIYRLAELDDSRVYFSRQGCDVSSKNETTVVHHDEIIERRDSC